MEIWAGVHDALSALLAERAGFDGLWLSSLGLSVARLGMPDAGYLSSEDVVTALSQIRAVVRLPISVDIENGYGLDVVELCGVTARMYAAGATSLCLEDSSGPKRNSLWRSQRRELYDVDTMVDRLARLCDARPSERHEMIARTEGLLEGESVDQVVERVRRYVAAGCSKVVVHFRQDVHEPLAVARAAGSDCDLVIIPTRAPDMTVAEFADAGFKVYIAANVALRAASAAMSSALKRVIVERSLAGALSGAATVEELDVAVRTAELVGDV